MCDEVVIEVSGEQLSLSANMVVLVSPHSGTRFHRVDGLGYETACKTTIDAPVRELSVSEAVQQGYRPCEKPGCFSQELQPSN